MNKELFNELREMLVEGMNEPYNREEDKNIPHLGEKRKEVLTLRKINQIKKMRNAKLDELAQDSIFVPYLYGPAEQPEGGDMMGGGMPM